MLKSVISTNDPSNTKQYYQIFLKNKNKNSVTKEDPKIVCKLSETIRQAVKVSEVSGAGKNSDSLLYGIIKNQTLLDERNLKTTKQSHAYKDYESSYNVKILNCFIPGLQLHKTESEN